MPLTKLVLENYRCFRERQEIELAPVTVVLGKNNSGKSVLTRAPLVIATGFDTDSTAPLDLEQLGPDAVDSFHELIFEQNPRGWFRLGVEVDGPTPFNFTATIQYLFDKKMAFVAGLDVQAPEVALSLNWELETDDESVVLYEVEQNGVRSELSSVAFRGLLPEPEGLPDPDRWARVRLELGPIRYLSPYRERPSRQHRLPLGAPRGLGTYGQGMPGILAHDRARNGGELIDLVNRRLQAIVPDWRIEQIPVGPLWSTVLIRAGSRVQVNLADAGTGLAQVLPIVVQCALDELSGDTTRSPLQIIEEPEMHLHPAAHAELADLYLNTARATGTRFLIETHSETLLLRLRRRIAEGDYPTEMIAVYVVEQVDGVSAVRRVGIDALGNLDDGWPEGYFSQDYHEVRALAAAQLERAGYAS